MTMLDGGRMNSNVCTAEDAGEPGRISTPPGTLVRAPLVSFRSHPRDSLPGISRLKEIGRTVDTRPTLLKVLLTERHWQRYETFRTEYERAAAQLAPELRHTARAGRSISAG